MKLNNEHKSILKSHGYDDWDLQQIEVAAKYMKYKISREPITEEKAIKTLGIDEFLLGLASATFFSCANRKNEYETVYFDGTDFFTSGKRKHIYGNLDSVKLHERWHSNEDNYETTTLYFYASSRFIESDFIDDDTVGTYISLEYPTNRKEASKSYVEISAICKDEESVDYHYCKETNPPYEFINQLFEIEERLIRNGEPINEKADDSMSFLVDGITECCSYDFGAEIDRANYCPVCGRKLVCE